MTREDIYSMGPKELKRSQVIAGVIDKKYSQVEAAEILDLSDRQIRRIVRRVEEDGEEGVIHKLKGKVSNRAYSRSFKARVLGIYSKDYEGFGPTLASEKFLERNRIRINDETLRLWLLESGDWQKKRRGRHHRKWRERKHHYGELVQMDGSHHDWLEGRAPKLVLMGYVDDATGEVFGRFYDYEGTFPALDSFKHYIERKGLPKCVYFDKHTTYKSNAKPSLEDELLNREALSQFGRALRELGVDFIHANSPQAKGRVERLFRTFQDRLIKEMRLAGITSKEEANRFLGRYLPKYNRRFRVEPQEAANMHRPLAEGINLDGILCLKTDKPLRNDFTVIHDKKMYQVLDKTKALRVNLEERLNGKKVISYKGESLRFKEIPMQLVTPPRRPKPVQVKTVEAKPDKPYKRPKNHPWNLAIGWAVKKKQVKKEQLKEKEAKRKGLWKLMDNPSGYPQLPQYGGYDLLQIGENLKPDISNLVKTGHF